MQHDPRYQEQHRMRVNTTQCPCPRKYVQEGFAEGIDQQVVPKLLPYDDEYDKLILEAYSQKVNKKIDAKAMNQRYLRYSFSFGRGNSEMIRFKLDQIFNNLDEDLDYINSLIEISEVIRRMRLYRIAQFLKEVEFLHPYEDGNTRTNFVVLNKILVENGFTPVIVSDINFPFTKNLSTMTNWLEQGIERWQKVAKAVNKSQDIDKALIDFDTKYSGQLLCDRKHLYLPANSIVKPC